MARPWRSADFSEDSEEKRPTVQVGDPFTEKLLIEACLELMASDAIVAIQDMGAAGLTSSSVEMASKGGVGIELDMNNVPCRETGMTPYEMMLSESQERMLMVLKPGREAEAEAIFRKWELDFAVIGRVTDTGRMVLTFNGEIAADIPLAPLADEAPLYDRPYLSREEYKAWAQVKPLGDVPESTDIAADLLKLMGSPDIASRRWIWEQYDQKVGGDTIQPPGGDAAVVRVHGTDKALAITTDCTPRYCYADPYEGGKQAIAEAYRNLCAVGATAARGHQLPELRQPAAARDHGPDRRLPRRDERGLQRARLPDRERQRQPLQREQGDGRRQRDPADPGDRRRRPDGGLAQGGRHRVRIEGAVVDARSLQSDRATGCGTHLGQSLWLREVHGSEAGSPPSVDLERRDDARRVRPGRDRRRAITACHDISDGGIAVASAEMALAAESVQLGGWATACSV